EQRLRHPWIRRGELLQVWKQPSEMLRVRRHELTSRRAGRDRRRRSARSPAAQGQCSSTDAQPLEESPPAITSRHTAAIVFAHLTLLAADRSRRRNNRAPCL